MSEEDGKWVYELVLDNLNPSSPADLWHQLEIRLIGPEESWTAPTCPDERPARYGTIGRTYNVTVVGPERTEAMKAALDRGEHLLAVTGTACYRHRGKVYRTVVCRVSNGKRTNDCTRGNVVD